MGGLRWLTARHLVAFAALGIGMIVAQPVVLLFAIPMDGPSGVILGIVGTLLLLTLAVGTLVLSLAVLRNNPLGIGGRVLGAMLPVLALTVLIGLLAPGWAHPGYVETVINFGIALIGVRAAEPRRFPEVTVTRGKDAVYFS